MAVVLHRQHKNGVNPVRLFCENGLPESHSDPIQWPFRVQDPVPAGYMVPVIYDAVPEGSSALPGLRSYAIPKPNKYILAEINAGMDRVLTRSG
jgi:hypothetical protein